jgi:hypothetical protein
MHKKKKKLCFLEILLGEPRHLLVGCGVLVLWLPGLGRRFDRGIGLGLGLGLGILDRRVVVVEEHGLLLGLLGSLLLLPLLLHERFIFARVFIFLLVVPFLLILVVLKVNILVILNFVALFNFPFLGVTGQLN